MPLRWVDDEAIARLLAAWGVDYLQGGLFGEPQAVVALPFVVRTMTPVLRSIDPRLLEAAALLGASPARAWPTRTRPASSTGSPAVSSTPAWGTGGPPLVCRQSVAERRTVSQSASTQGRSVRTASGLCAAMARPSAWMGLARPNAA